MLKAGDTFLLPPQANVIEHLWVVLTDPDTDGNAICANITSEDPDHTVELFLGDHPFINHPSVVRYRDARPINIKVVVAAIEGKIDRGGMVCRSHQPCSVPVLVRIRKGLLDSPHTPKKIKAVCAAAWGIDWPPKKTK